MRELHIIVDLQYGSTGKGLFAGYLALQRRPDVIVTAWGPNAGHTFIDAAGRRYVNIALPNGLVANPAYILLGPGSAINPDQLLHEIGAYEDLLGMTAILIHEHAAVVTQEHRDTEAGYGFKIGSTMKGVGEAAIHKIRRMEPLNIAREALRGTPLEQYVVTAATYNRIVDEAKCILVEGAQGFSLGINSGFYPHVTSRECTVAQVLSDCALPFSMAHDATIYGVARTYPIRVANRHDAAGNQIGTSGPCYQDQFELEWSSLGMQPELTTVTRLPRRIFTWSKAQINDAIRANGVDAVFLNFANYMNPDKYKIPKVQPEFHTILRDCRNAGALVHWLGQGPSINDIHGK